MTVLIAFLVSALPAGASPENRTIGTLAEDPPTTGFEQSDGEDHTTHEQELSFLEAVAAGSPRMAYDPVGESVQGRPLHLVRLGYPAAPTAEEASTGRSVLVIGAQHGNEPAGREAALKLLRDFAFTDDPDLIDQLSETTLLFLPTSNPDGRVADTRGNAGGVDLNRDHLLLATPEGRVMAGIFRDFRPEIVIDAHEGPSTPNNPDQTPRLELSWARNLNVDTALRELSQSLVEDHVFPAIEAAGYSTGIYGSPGGAGGGDERILRNAIGLRHSLGILIETFNATPAARVDLQMRTIHEIFRFHREYGADVAATIEGSRTRATEAGANQSRPFYLGGADWEEPSSDEVLDPAPCGYLLNPWQLEVIDRQVEYFSLEAEEVAEGSFLIAMAQPQMTVIPLLLDPRASHPLVEGKALEDCSDPGSLEPPEPPPPSSPPARFFTDFLTDEPGEAPADWSMPWTESDWAVQDDPRLLRHTVDNTGGRRSLVWNRPGIVSGDVEVVTKVRSESSNTLFQLPLHVSGQAGNENAYYVDVRVDQSSIRINRYVDGSFSTIGSTSFEPEQDTWYWVRFRREGNGLMAKIWQDGQEEPSEWQVTLTDNNHQSGSVGFAGFQSNSVNDWAFLGVGVGGETAPDSCDIEVALVAETLVTAGSSWSATVEAEGPGPFTYEWQREGEIIPDANESTFTLDRVAMDDSGLYTVNVSTPCGATSTAEVDLSVQELTFNTWPPRETFPQDRQGPGDRNGPLDLPNLLAYAMALNPMSATPADLPRLLTPDPDGQVAHVRYQRALNLPDVVLNLEVSPNLTEWTPATIDSTEVLQSDGWMERVEIETPLPEARSFFIRVNAEMLSLP